MSEIIDLTKIKRLLSDFSQSRDWEKFHNAKNLSMAVANEAGELLEIFQWLTEHESDNIKNNPENKIKVEHEIADIMLYLIRLATRLDIDINTALHNKMELNNRKYPAHQVKGSAKKYDEYSQY